MKIKTLFYIVLVLIINSAYGQELSKQQIKKNQYQEIVALADSGKFIFEANKAIAQGGKMIDLSTNPNFLKFTRKNAIADLPFFGERYIVNNFGSDEGINFDAIPQDYKIELNEEKLQIEIQFKIETKEDIYDCYFNISYSGSTTLNINTNTRSQIKYLGEISPIKP